MNTNPITTHYTDRSIMDSSIKYMLIILSMLVHPVSEARASVDDPAVTSLQAEVADLQSRVRQLEQQLTAVLQMVKQDAAPVGASRSPVKETIVVKDEVRTTRPSISVGGRVKVDAIFNSRTAGGPSNRNHGDLSFASGNIPLDGTGKRDQLNFSARETRLWVTARVPTEAATLGAYVEMDFSSGDDSGNEKVSNSYVPRLRHAYVNYGDFTAGQTWSTFMNVSAFPDMNDTGGPAGIINIRQPMLRYQHDQDWGRFYLALEQPESTLTTAAGVRTSTDDEQFPDVVGKLEFTGDWGNWSLAGMLRQVRIDDSGATDSSWGGAVSTSGRINAWGTDNIRFALSYGNALGRYLSLNGFDDGFLGVGNKIELTTMYGGYVSYQHWWSERLRTSLTLGYSRADSDFDFLPTFAAPVVNKSMFSSHLNLLWSLTTAATVGVEWIHGERHLEDGRDGSLDRIQFTSMFRF